MKRKFYLAVISAFLLINCLTAQTVQVISNLGTSQNIVSGGNPYHASESVYLGSEIGSTNFLTTATSINRIDFYLYTLSAPDSFANYTLYLKEGTASKFASGTYNISGYKQVYTGKLRALSTGWVGVNLTTPFVRTSGTKNLQLYIVRKDGVAPVGFTWLASIGSSTSTSDSTTRRFNGTTSPATGTAMTASVFRPAIQFKHIPPGDASLSTYVFPTVSCFTSNQSVSVSITNVGTATTINAGEATVSLNVTGTNSYTGSASNVGSIPVGGSEVVTFSGINLNTYGSNTFTAIVSYTSDGDHSNDTLRTTYSSANTLNAYPITEDAETSPPDVFAYRKVLFGARNLWSIKTANYGNPDMTNIDPTDSLSAHGGSNYYLFDAYSGANSTGLKGIVYSNCVTIPSGSGYTLNFYMTHDTLFQTSMDSLFLDVSTDHGATWYRLQGFQRVDTSSSNGNYNYALIGWGQHSVDISAFAGQTVQFAFEGQSDYGNVIGLDDIEIDQLLPVKYISFKGSRVLDFNNLTWITANETNNTGFELQRSTDGRAFEKIAFIETKAKALNSTSELKYEYTDRNAIAGTNYYRLKQIDKNGIATFSDVVVIKSGKNNFEISSIYPNPATTDIKLSVNASNATTATITLTDVYGRTIKTVPVQINEGTSQVSIPVQTLKSGSYFLKLNSGEGTSKPMMFEKK